MPSFFGFGWVLLNWLAIVVHFVVLENFADVVLQDEDVSDIPVLQLDMGFIDSKDLTLMEEDWLVRVRGIPAPDNHELVYEILKHI
jgi:hypothetical protein